MSLISSGLLLPLSESFKDEPVPSQNGEIVRLYAAQNEFEPFQIVVNPVSNSNINIQISDFGSGIITEIYQVKYVNIEKATDNLGKTGDYPDPLWPLENNAAINLSANKNTAFWFSVFVPKGTPSGDYTANVSVEDILIPVNLHVFNFAIPDEVHVKSQMGLSFQAFLNKYSVTGTDLDYWFYVDKIKQFFIDHRLTPKSTLWPGGVTSSGGAPFIEYDCNGTLSDSYGIWGFELLADKYFNGTGFNNGTGFPYYMAAMFKNNDSSLDQRPQTFCGLTRSESDWLANPDSPYNKAWFNYMAALENYLNSIGYLERSYYYIANEPQDQPDYDAVAWYSQELKKTAPQFKLMVSEEPRPEIYNHPVFKGSKIDIWLPVLNNYDPVVSHKREKNHGEVTWIYFLHGTRPPFFNPITLDHPGIENKFLGWFLWKYRIQGIAYYVLNHWSQNPWTDPMSYNQNGELFMLYPPSETNEPIAYGSNNHRFVPSIRFELMRDSLEDYEYLYLLNSSALPQVEVENPADALADKIIKGLTSYNRRSEYLYNLRRVLGQKLGSEIADIPELTSPAPHPRAEGMPGNYFINFQDPQGDPSSDSLVVDGKTYMKIGWDTYDEKGLGYGWLGDMSHVMYRYLTEGPNELQKSILYDDWGRQKTFNFILPNGTYKVTVSVGWQGRKYEHNKISIQGVDVIDDEPSDPYLVRTSVVTVSDYTLSMEMGIFDEYTMLNYLDIEAVIDEIPLIADFTANPKIGNVPLEVEFTDTSTGSPVSWAWDFESNGVVDSIEKHPIHTYDKAGTYTVTLTVSNESSSNTVIKKNYISVETGQSIVAQGAVLTIAASELGLLQFEKKPKVYGTYTDPVTGKSNSVVKLAVINKINKKNPASFILSCWKKPIQLYNKKDYTKVKLSQALTTNPVSNLAFTSLLVKPAGQDPIALNRPVTFAAPVITSIHGSPVSGEDITIRGLYYGNRTPKILIEYTKDNKLGYKSCRIDKEASYRFKDAKGRERKSCMKILANDIGDEPIGYSEVKCRYPFLKKGKKKPTGFIIVDNKSGLAAGEF